MGGYCIREKLTGNNIYRLVSYHYVIFFVIGMRFCDLIYVVKSKTRQIRMELTLRKIVSPLHTVLDNPYKLPALIGTGLIKNTTYF